MTYVITQACVDITDRACMTQCPVDCIIQGDRMMYIDPEGCVDCGACRPVCPQNAIFDEDEVPAEFSMFTDINREFFEDPTIGAESGGETTGIDHHLIAALPRR